ncbi:MAG TPA: tyrosine-protein phosphatase [Tessaracoccus flavescens]|uniref:Tyrosine-protein phosphatase n=1 Tax=Tessaracoccus flavescens TaxID=399497 RepID=A0A921ELZ7_9ACTN|nr:tyrosine-protein phosphatase [Tessaracoccus flavescens]
MGWDGAVNAHQVAPGVVRMGRREWVTEQGWSQALGEGYRTVVDLRSEIEFAVRRKGDANVSAAALDGLTVLHRPTEDPDHPGFDYPMGYLDHPADYAGYLEMFGDRVARALLAVGHADGPVIVHCSAGRDRTGLVLSLGQLVAGWSHDDIVDGYVAAAEGINAFQAHNPHPKETHKVGEEWEAWLGERVSALRSFLDETNAVEFLRRQGATDADIAAVAARFDRTCDQPAE